MNTEEQDSILSANHETATTAQPAAAGCHPNLLLVKWEIHFRNRQWHSACEVAQALIDAMPNEPIGFIYRSFALQKIGRVQEARKHLLTAARLFPTDWRIAYNLACYTCELGDIAGTWNWLDRAIELGDSDAVKSLALDEIALRPLWQWIGRERPAGVTEEQMFCA